MFNRITNTNGLQAAYHYAADGTKLGVSDSGDNGFQYVGSLTYLRDSGGLHLEKASLPGGEIRQTRGYWDARYYATDHQGSIRAVYESTGRIIEQNDYYPFGLRHENGSLPLSDNRMGYNGKEMQTTGDLDLLDYGARMYDPLIGRWLGCDPLAEQYYGLSSYNYCGNNPVLMIDPDGRKYTHYVDKNYNVLLQTDDGSDDIVLIPKSKVKKFMTFFELYTTSQDHSVFDSPGWNQHWKSEFGLADRQFTEGEIAVLNQFSTDWSRNSAAAYLLNPTVANALQMGLSEGLSQWTNIELVAGGLSAGIAGWQSVVRRAAAAKAIVIGEGMGMVKTTAKTLQSQGINAQWYQAWSKNFPTNRLMTPIEMDAALMRNARWLNTKIDQSFKIYDIGIDVTRTTRSPFYQLEQNILQRRGYSTTKIPR